MEDFGLRGLGFRAVSDLGFRVQDLVSDLGFRVVVAEWIHFTLFGIMLPAIKLKVYTFWCL